MFRESNAKQGVGDVLVGGGRDGGARKGVGGGGRRRFIMFFFGSRFGRPVFNGKNNCFSYYF